MKKVYIVLLNFNGSLDTIECLESLLKLEYNNFQIIVVDNSETNLPFEDLEEWAVGNFVLEESFLPNHVFPIIPKPVNFISISEKHLSDLIKELDKKVIFVKAEKNMGFAAGNNIALQYILKLGKPGSYIWLLNNDTVVEKNVLPRIMSEIDNQPYNLIFGTPLMEYYNPGEIQAIGGVYNKKTGFIKHFGEQMPVSEYINFGTGHNIDYPIGASMIISKSFLEKLGLLCEDYFLYFEELDWSFRAKKLQGGIKILNCFGVYHKQGNSTKAKALEKKSELIDLVSLNSRILFARKYNGENFFLIQLSILILTVGKRVFQGKLRIIPKIIRLVLKGGVVNDENFFSSIGYKKRQ